jgi:hypothetical protein
VKGPLGQGLPVPRYGQGFYRVSALEEGAGRLYSGRTKKDRNPHWRILGVLEGI